MDENMIEQMNIWKVLDTLKMNIKVGEKAGRSDKVFYYECARLLLQKNENESQMKSVFFMDMTWIFYLLHLKEHRLSGIKAESVLTAVCKVRELLKRLEAFWNQNDTRKAEIASLLI